MNRLDQFLYMNDQYFNFNFPTQSSGTIMNCENIHCTKGFNFTIRTSISPTMCTYCHKLYCYSCYQTPIHSCDRKNTIPSDSINVIPNCSRCRIKASSKMCIKCNSQYFCQECCRIVHSIKKFSFHPVTSMNCVYSDNRNKIHSYQQQQQRSIKPVKSMVRQHYHKKSPSYVQLESLNLNLQQQNIYQFPCQQNYTLPSCQQQQSLFNINTNNKQPVINTLQTLSSKVQLSQSLIGLKKSQIKFSQLSVKQKYQRISSSIQSTFGVILQKIHQKQYQMKLFIQKQLQSTMNQITSIGSLLKQLQIENNNIKLLIEKNNKKTSRSSISLNSNNNDSLMMTKFINDKFIKNESKLNTISTSNNLSQIVDKKIQLSKQFNQMFKRIQDQIDSFSLQYLLKNNNNDEEKSLIVRNFDQTSLGSNHKDRKKPLMINTSTKYNKKTDTINTLTTSKKHLNNISFSHQLNNTQNQHMINVKNKKRKTSIQLHEMMMDSNNNKRQQGKLLEGQQKAKQLQRIKSFDFLSSTVASLSSSSQLKTEKKIVRGKKQHEIMSRDNNISGKNKNNLNLSINININDNDNDNYTNDNNNDNNLSELKLDSNRNTSSTQQLSLNFIRNKMNDTSLVEEVKSLNFLTTSSQLLPSIENLPDVPVIQTTRPKHTLHYSGMSVNSPKSNVYHYNSNNTINNNNNTINNKQRTHTNNNQNNNNSSNKTFSGTTLTSSIKSPTNKIITSAFKSPKVKHRYMNDKKQQITFNHLSPFDHVANTNCNKQQRNTIKKMVSSTNRVLTTVNKE